MTTRGLKFSPLEVEQQPIPRLCHGLDRVLFNPGVYQLQDPRTRVFNFDPYLHKVLPVSEFNFKALQMFETPSQDSTLGDLAKRSKAKFYGSTSSMTGMLKHFHFLLSQWRSLTFDMLSRTFDPKTRVFSQFTKMPAAVFLRHRNGRYAIDADKYFDRQNIMSLLGHSLEKLLTLPSKEYDRYKLSHANGITADEENQIPNSYHYTTAGSILTRSQLDAHDPRLPGTGVFDIKTRAVVSIRAHGQTDHRAGLGYELRQEHGQWESFERELYDLTRNSMLAYSLQARLGRMDGIFMAYHNIERIFGFQYLGLEDLDLALHGQKDTFLGDEEFKLSLKLLQKVLTQVTDRFPQQSVRLHFETRSLPAFMYIFAEPMEETEADAIQSRNKRKNEKLTKHLLGLENGEEEEEDMDPDDVDEIAWQKLRAKPEPDESGRSHYSIITGEKHPDIDGKKTRPLLALTLTIRNKVNGQAVQRPENPFAPGDKWKVEYSFSEIESARQAWALYEATKKRRAEILDNEQEPYGLKEFRRQVVEFAKKGREWRAEQDRRDTEAVVFAPYDDGKGGARQGKKAKKSKDEWM
ncbi:Pet127-domain-containing protein [Rhizodiscina lignyota]|uniref:Pet127-domain-containing protein n=1 Tax=Rhizodiscina lignyota TaxID=1504668 RepID=A0A9P4IBI0_9PEZI|nr:Pet127-domain-containing protein [Rhizodiscina lignyota]